MTNRIIYSKNGVLEDFSTTLSRNNSSTKEFKYETGKDFLYISSRLPFNNINFKLSVKNLLRDATMIVEYFDGTAWAASVDLLDETLGFSKSGHIQFTPNKKKSWVRKDTDSVLGLETLNIYDQYWIRVSFDADLNGPVVDENEVPLTYQDLELCWVGNVFSDDSDLAIEFPDLVRTENLNSFKLNKIDWEEQHIKAGELIISDMINKNIIIGAGQILDWREFTGASVSKTSEIIFTAFGDDYADNVISSRREYTERLSKRLYRVDQNNNATEDTDESFVPVAGYFTR